MSVGRLCTRCVDLADLEESVQAAAQRMLERNVGTLVVLNIVRRPIGILTDRDLALRVLAPGKNPRDTRVREVMTWNPTTISENAPIESALNQMRSGGFRRLPVTRLDGELVGLISLDDILSLLSEEFFELGTIVEKETPVRAGERRRYPAGVLRNRRES